MIYHNGATTPQRQLHARLELACNTASRKPSTDRALGCLANVCSCRSGSQRAQFYMSGPR